MGVVWWAVIFAALAGSAYTLFVVLTIEASVCIPSDAISAPYEQTILYLNGVVEFDMTMATALVSLGAALLLGIQGNIQLTLWRLTLVFLSMFGFAQAVMYRIMWKPKVANLMVNNCWSSIASPEVQQWYISHLYFMLVGVGVLVILVLLLSIERLREKKSGGDDDDKGGGSFIIIATDTMQHGPRR